MDVEDMESHIGWFHGLVQTQSREVAYMSTRVKKIALPKINELYFTSVRVNEGYYKTKVNKDFHLRSNNIAQLLGVPNFL